jgi:hypothetical protein
MRKNRTEGKEESGVRRYGLTLTDRIIRSGLSYTLSRGSSVIYLLSHAPEARRSTLPELLGALMYVSVSTTPFGYSHGRTTPSDPYYSSLIWMYLPLKYV